MGIDGQSIAHWEKSDKVPRWAAMLVRLLFLAHAQGNQPIRKALERIKTAERLDKQRFIVHESNGHCEHSLQEGDALPARVSFDG